MRRPSNGIHLMAYTENINCSGRAYVESYSMIMSNGKEDCDVSWEMSPTFRRLSALGGSPCGTFDGAQISRREFWLSDWSSRSKGVEYCGR